MRKRFVESHYAQFAGPLGKEEGSNIPVNGRARRWFRREARCAFSAVEFVSPETGWLAGGGRIFRTEDGGVHWTTQRSGAGGVVAFDFVSASMGWSVLTNGLLRTRDGGVHWKLVSKIRLDQVDFVAGLTGWAVKPSPRGEVIAGGTVTQGYLVRSDDGGQTWNRAASIPAQTVCFNSSSSGWVASRNQVFHTTDGGQNWHRSLRATLLQPRVAGGPEWLATIHCSPQHEWIVFSAPDGGRRAKSLSSPTQGATGAGCRCLTTDTLRFIPSSWQAAVGAPGELR